MEISSHCIRGVMLHSLLVSLGFLLLLSAQLLVELVQQKTNKFLSIALLIP